jgi:hypothetical protein
MSVLRSVSTDGSYTYPDSNGGGRWKKVDPVPETDSINTAKARYRKKVKHLARMMRAWKAKNGVSMGGLLMDTLAYNFMDEWKHNAETYLYYDWMTRDFLEYLYDQDRERKYWHAPGSNQRVYRSGIFEYKAGQAYQVPTSNGRRSSALPSKADNHVRAKRTELR